MLKDKHLKDDVNALTLLVKLQDVEINDLKEKIKEGEEASIKQ
jgi:hypothetical protein